MQIRNVEKRDDKSVAQLIRSVLTEYGANRPGFAWQDPELDHMTQAYARDDRCYKVLEDEGKIVGAGGFGPFVCPEYEACCELQKMYLFPEARGKGWGRALIEQLQEEARRYGYQYMYLESLSSMREALSLYQKQGFKALSKPLGDSGHNACDEWLILSLG
jgi:putative acetyltransferase